MQESLPLNGLLLIVNSAFMFYVSKFQKKNQSESTTKKRGVKMRKNKSGKTDQGKNANSMINLIDIQRVVQNILVRHYRV